MVPQPLAAPAGAHSIASGGVNRSGHVAGSASWQVRKRLVSSAVVWSDPGTPVALPDMAGVTGA